jgi:PAS domain S-box-containing protein
MTLACVPASPTEQTDFYRLAMQALQSVDAAVSIVDLQTPDQALVFVNEAFCSLTGYSAAQALGRNCRMLQHPDVDPATVRMLREAIAEGVAVRTVLRNRRRDGSDFWNLLHLVPLAASGHAVTHYVGFQQDLSEWSLSAHAVLSTDEQGPGAAAARFDQAVNDALRKQVSTPQRHVLLALRGAESAMDATSVLSLPQRVSAGARLRPLLSAGATLHFTASGGLTLLAPLQERQTAGMLALRAIALLLPVWPCVVGVAELQTDGHDARALTAVAEEASLRAQTEGSDGLCFADARRDAADRRTRQLLQDLAGALAARQFRLVFQPIIDLASGALTGFEALLRWHHPTLGEVMPGEFIAQLEHRPEIVAVTHWVLRQALEQLRRWDTQLDRPLRISVNVPVEVLLDDAFVSFTLAELERLHLSPRQLEVELTERSMASANGPAVARLQELRSHGMLVAIDDFGTGWSSLAYLAQLPVDTLKVDMQFTRGVTNSRADAAIARMTVELARGLGLRCVAEGIERPGQHRFFTDLHCAEGQGYLFGRPLEVDAVDALLSAPLCFFPVEASAPASATPPRHLLILDDEENVLRALRRTLRPGGFQIHITTSPDEAFEMLALQPVSVVLSDQRMPQMTGSEFLRRVKDRHPSTKRIVLSGYTDLQSITEAINQGAIYKFLTKPWNDAELLALLETAFTELELEAENQRLHDELQHANRQLAQAYAAQTQRLSHGETALDVMHAAIGAVAVPVLGLDPAGDLVMINAAAEKLLAHDLPMLGEPISALLGFNPDPDTIDPPRRVALAGRDFTVHSTSMRTGARTLGLVLTLLESTP